MRTAISVLTMNNRITNVIRCQVLIECPPTASMSSVVARLKAVSSKFFLKRYGAQCWGKHERTLWNAGYFVASTGGVTLEILKKYVENQGRR